MAGDTQGILDRQCVVASLVLWLCAFPCQNACSKLGEAWPGQAEAWPGLATPPRLAWPGLAWPDLAMPGLANKKNES